MVNNRFITGRDEVMDDPTDLSRDDYRAALKRTIAEVKRDDVAGLAAGVAFKIFLSLFPAMFAGVAIFSIVTTPTEIAKMLTGARAVVPTQAIDLIQQPLTRLAESDGGRAGLAAVTGIAAGLWAATGAAISLMRALSRAYDAPETRKFVKQRLHALGLILALLLALVTMVLLLVVGPQLQAALLPDIVAPLTWLLAALRFALALVVLVVLFAFVYYLGPNRDHPSWAWMSPGALVAVIGWLLVAGGFTLYAQTTDNYQATYGAIAGVAVLLIWLQLSMLVLLVGAEFNAEVERTRTLQVAVGEGAGFAAPAGAAPGVPPDAESRSTALQQTQVAAHTVEPTAPADQQEVADARAAPPPGPPPIPSPATARPSTVTGTPAAKRAGAVAAGAMAIAVFLGFARQRGRR